MVHRKGTYVLVAYALSPPIPMNKIFLKKTINYNVISIWYESTLYDVSNDIDFVMYMLMIYSKNMVKFLEFDFQKIYTHMPYS
jgi:hypothetical protein